MSHNIPTSTLFNATQQTEVSEIFIKCNARQGTNDDGDGICCANWHTQNMKSEESKEGRWAMCVVCFAGGEKRGKYHIRKKDAIQKDTK